MKGKTMIFSLLIMSLLMAQIQVEARTCCPSTKARNGFSICLMAGSYSKKNCISMNGCQASDTCPPGWENGILENSGDVVNEYCKLGCETSVCGAMNTLKNSDASEIVKGSLEQCAKACSTFCTKSS
ncbi:PREDICTED: thionin-2.1-like [Camelina sativa]|uniref:Thionin-2.1-like n=1 Tax=Camelina sativa TaxID=90675 RepID=A0ABM0SQX9_CAMSA|nr:PREDICTED: thionin-2.1-like [Camelina sativa]